MRRALLTGLWTCLLTTSAQAAPLDVDGLWIASSRDDRVKAHVRISDCGDGTPCGRLAWIDSTGRERARNERHAVRARRPGPLIGTPILWGFAKDDRGWRGGRVYNPEDGAAFASSLSKRGADQLRVTGCLGPICETKTWIRVTHD